jgi:Holliday junction DNA helicase RuvB
MNDERLVTPTIQSNENEYEVRLRPRDFSEYVGQSNVVENVSLMVASSIKRSAAMDHALLSGPPGLGKTSLAMIIAAQLGSQLHMISGPAIEKKGDLAAILTNLKAKDVLFIDEIHRIPIAIEEILYSAMEDYRLDILIGQGPSARTMQIDIAPFTLIGATTRSGLLSNPLRERFTAILNFDFYGQKDLATIIKNNANKMQLKYDQAGIELMSSCARGTPRVANRILRRVRDYLLVYDSQKIDEKIVKEALKLMQIDHAGLDSMDRKILQVILDFYAGGPVGIDALSATLGEDRTTLEEVYEPYLLKEGFIVRSPRGRLVTDLAKNHLIQMKNIFN